MESIEWIVKAVSSVPYNTRILLILWLRTFLSKSVNSTASYWLNPRERNLDIDFIPNICLFWVWFISFQAKKLSSNPLTSFINSAEKWDAETWTESFWGKHVSRRQLLAGKIRKSESCTGHWRQFIDMLCYHWHSLSQTFPRCSTSLSNSSVARKNVFL